MTEQYGSGSGLSRRATSGLILASVDNKASDSASKGVSKPGSKDRTANMGEIVAVNFRAGRKLSGFLPEETAEAPHMRQRSMCRFFGFAGGDEPAIICRPESYGPDDFI